jgi:hypothetical protein
LPIIVPRSGTATISPDGVTRFLLGIADFPFNWEMIRSGDLSDHPAATRFLAAVTDNRGRFRFTQIPRNSEVEIAIWGQGIAPRRADHLELAPEDASESIEIALQPPAQIVGTVDRTAFPGAISIFVSRGEAAFGPEHLQFQADQTDFEIADLAPGEYEVSMMTSERENERQGGLNIQVMSTAKITVRSGETGRVNFKE